MAKWDIDKLRNHLKDSKGEDFYTDPRFSHKILPTGIYSLDGLLAGGLRGGTYTEFFGPESVGKTYIALRCMAQCQQLWELPVAYIDCEMAWSGDRAEELGVDLEGVYVARFPDQEKTFDWLKKAIRSNEFGLIVVDSVAGMVPSLEAESDISNQVAPQARVNSMGFRNITPGLQDTAVLFINQVRDQIGAYGDPTSSPGGRAIKHYAHFRVKFGKLSAESEKVKAWDPREHGMRDRSIANSHLIRVKLEKSKFSSPMQTCDLLYSYDLNGIDIVEDLLAYLMDHRRQVVTREGRFFYVEGKEKKINGYPQTYEFFANADQEYIDSLVALAQEKEKNYVAEETEVESEVQEPARV